MRPYFFKRNVRADVRAFQFQQKQRVASLKKAKPKGTVFVRAIQAIKSLMPRRLTETDRWYLQRAAEKRARRRARNLSWWANDPGWHRERLGI